MRVIVGRAVSHLQHHQCGVVPMGGQPFGGNLEALSSGGDSPMVGQLLAEHPRLFRVLAQATH